LKTIISFKQLLGAKNNCGFSACDHKKYALVQNQLVRLRCLLLLLVGFVLSAVYYLVLTLHNQIHLLYFLLSLDQRVKPTLLICRVFQQ
jgi:hypothetical protein